MSAFALGMIIFAYLCGSISSAILVCKLAGLPDPRTHGSGNPGATNVLRLGGKVAAASVLVFDVLKGMVPVWLAYLMHVTPLYLGLTAIAACLGHIYPVFFSLSRWQRRCDGIWCDCADWLGLNRAGHRHLAAHSST